jgi:hypothetical protein
MTAAEQIHCMVDFLNQIGIPTIFETLEESTFLPGILIDSGGMRIDQSKLAYPGDLLHEAGHIAVALPEDRIKMVGDAGGGGMGDEIAAMLWSFAAAKALNLPEEIIFHAGGYQGSSSWFVEHYRDQQHYIGLPLLEWMGLTAGPAKAETLGVPPFPHMLRWLRI